jgi:hypothetical protein
MANRYWGRRWNVFSIDKGRLEEVSVLAGATLLFSRAASSQRTRTR